MVAEIFGMDGVIVLIVVIAVLFGSSQIPKLARSLGSAQNEFKKGIEEGKSASDKADEKDTKASRPLLDTPTAGLSPRARPSNWGLASGWCGWGSTLRAPHRSWWACPPRSSPGRWWPT